MAQSSFRPWRLASTAEAKSNIYLQLGFGSGWVGAGPGWGYGPGMGNPCWYYWKKYKKTGSGYWKMKYNKCMWYY